MPINGRMRPPASYCVVTKRSRRRDGPPGLLPHDHRMAGGGGEPDRRSRAGLEPDGPGHGRRPGQCVGGWLLVILGRRLAPHKDPRAGLVRSWIAISLVLGLLVFCAASLAIGDSALRSTLVGALAAAVGAAIAFYFSAHQADQSRQDLLTAAAGTVTVPEITDLTLAKASALLAKTSLRLLIDPASSALADDDRSHVATQDPDPGTEARRGSTVRITLEPSPDTTTGSTAPVM